MTGIRRHAGAIQVVASTHIESEAGVEARDDADLVIIRQRARNPVTDVELRIEDAAEDECVSLVGERVPTVAPAVGRVRGKLRRIDYIDLRRVINAVRPGV